MAEEATFEIEIAHEVVDSSDDDEYYDDDCNEYGETIFDINKIKKWEPDLVNKEGEDYPGIITASMYIIGQRGTGKSFLARHLLGMYKDYLHHGLVITNTTFSGYWQQVFPTAAVIDVDIMDGALRMYIENQEDNVRKWRDGQLDIRKAAGFVVFDDWVSDPKHARYSVDVVKLFTEGRHLLTWVVALSQYPKAVSTYTRNNLDYTIILRQNKIDTRDHIWRDHLGMIPKRETTKLYNFLKRDKHLAIVANESAYVETIYDAIMWWKADDTFGYFDNPGKHTKFGDPVWVRRMEMVYNDNHGRYRPGGDILTRMNSLLGTLSPFKI